VSRIDHGVRWDQENWWKAKGEQIPDRVPALQRVKLRVFDIRDHNLKRMRPRAWRTPTTQRRGGYVDENFHAAREGLHLSGTSRLAKNSLQLLGGETGC